MLPYPQTEIPWPRGIIFDLDGTLLESSRGITLALNQIRRRRGGEELSEVQARDWISLGASALVRNGLGQLALDPLQDLAEFRACYATIATTDRDLFPNVAEMLRDLHRRDIRIGICTNKPQSLTEPILESLGLSSILSAIVGGREGLRPKPHPDALFLTLNEMQLDPADVVYVGDSEVDSQTARAAGIPFLLVTFGYALGAHDAIPADALIHHFQELPRTLEELRSAQTC